MPECGREKNKRRDFEDRRKSEIRIVFRCRTDIKEYVHLVVLHGGVMVGQW